MKRLQSMASEMFANPQEATPEKLEVFRTQLDAVRDKAPAGMDAGKVAELNADIDRAASMAAQAYLINDLAAQQGIEMGQAKAIIMEAYGEKPSMERDGASASVPKAPEMSEEEKNTIRKSVEAFKKSLLSGEDVKDMIAGIGNLFKSLLARAAGMNRSQTQSGPAMGVVNG